MKEAKFKNGQVVFCHADLYDPSLPKAIAFRKLKIRSITVEETIKYDDNFGITKIYYDCIVADKKWYERVAQYVRYSVTLEEDDLFLKEEVLEIFKDWLSKD